MCYKELAQIINQPYIDRKGVQKLLNTSSNEARRVLHTVNNEIDALGQFRIKRKKLSAPTWKVLEMLHIDADEIRREARNEENNIYAISN